VQGYYISHPIDRVEAGLFLENRIALERKMAA